MNKNNQLTVRDRAFEVKNASVVFNGKYWQVEIETERREFDEEWWCPRLYHQGLLLAAKNGSELQGIRSSWSTSDDPSYQHPELGIMYVFGHHTVRDCTISFEKLESGKVGLSWVGICDIFWDGDYSENVPFSCHCGATVVG